MTYTGDTKKQHLTLTDSDRAALTELPAKGSLSARTFKRATARLELDRSKTLTAVAETLDVDDSTVAIWRNTYRPDGLTFLTDAPRSGRPMTIDGAQRATITALAAVRRRTAIAVGRCSGWLTRSWKPGAARRCRIPKSATCSKKTT